jgi:hypothetical protein
VLIRLLAQAASTSGCCSSISFILVSSSRRGRVRAWQEPSQLRVWPRTRGFVPRGPEDHKSVVFPGTPMHRKTQPLDTRLRWPRVSALARRRRQLGPRRGDTFTRVCLNGDALRLQTSRGSRRRWSAARRHRPPASTLMFHQDNARKATGRLRAQAWLPLLRGRQIQRCAPQRP